MKLLLGKQAAAASFAGLVAALWALAGLLTPAEEMTRFRNALLAEVGAPADFDWTPDSVPADFHDESLAAPAEMANALRDMPTGTGAVDAMQGLVAHLRGLPKRRGPIQASTVEAYRIIRSEGRGYCADYTQVFNGISHAIRLPVREWGMSFDRFSGDGHAFSEIWSRELQQWVFVDPMHGFYVRDEQTGRPLAALDFRSRLAQGRARDTVEVVPIANAFMFDSAAEVFDYYRRGTEQFYLWFGNDVFSYDAHPVVRALGALSRPAEQLAAILVGIHPTLRIYPTAGNMAEIDSLFRLRTQVIALAAVAACLGLLLVVQALSMLRRRVGPPAAG